MESVTQIDLDDFCPFDFVPAVAIVLAVSHDGVPYRTMIVSCDGGSLIC